MFVPSERTLLTSAVILCSLFFIAGSQEGVVEQCTTPSGSLGTCVVLFECSALDRLVRTGDRAHFEFLRKSHCGFNKTMPKVCCSSEIDKLLINFPKDGISDTASTRPTDHTSIFLTTPYTPPPAQKEPRPTSELPPAASTSNQNKPSFSVSNRTNYTLTNPSTNETFDEIHTVVISTPSPPQMPLQSHDLGEAESIEGSLLPSRDVCGFVANNNKIYGGENANIEEFPWMALLKYNVGTKEQFGCGGVLISNRYVLTAAHCIRTPNNYKIVQVRLGEWDTATPSDCEDNLCNAPPVDIAIEETIVYPDFESKNLTNDIALIRLVTPVNFTEWIQPICLPDSKDRDFTEEVFSVAGWGQTEEGSSSRIKRKVEINNVNLDVCSVAYSKLKITLGPGNLCAGGRRGQDTCRGDSGGSLMKVLNLDHKTNYYAIGVVSLGPRQCGLEGWPGVYTKVSHYVEWVKSNLRH